MQDRNEEKSYYQSIKIDPAATGSNVQMAIKIAQKVGLKVYQLAPDSGFDKPDPTFQVHNTKTKANTEGFAVSSKQDITRYAYVVMNDEQSANGLTFRMGDKGHAYLTGGVDCVAAGDIVFNKGAIEQITDKSGGYHLDSKDSNLVEKQKSILSAMRDVGLPMNKFQSEYINAETCKQFITTTKPVAETLATKDPDSSALKINNAATVQPPSALNINPEDYKAEPQSAPSPISNRI